MGLSDRVTNRASQLSRSVDPVTLEEFGYLLAQGGGQGTKTNAGVTMGVRRALSIPAWYSGVYFLSTSVAFLPTAAYRNSPSTGRSRRSDPPWLRKPDDEMPWPALLEFWVMSLLHRGNAYAFKLRSATGQVTGLRAIHPDRVRVGQTGTGQKIFEIDGRDDIGFTTREILHIPGLSYDGIMGLDPIRVHANALGTVAAAEEFAGRSFGQGTHLQAYISVPDTITQDQAELLSAQWKRFHQGVQNSNELGVLGNGAEYRTITLDPEQTQLLQSRKYGTTQIAQLLRIPPHKLYDLENATFSNIEHQAIEAGTDGVRPWVERIETWLNFDLDLMPVGNNIELDMDGLMRGDIITRSNANAVAVQNGAMSPKEWREKESWDYAPGLDYFLVPLNMDQIGPDAVEKPDPPAPLATPEPPNSTPDPNAAAMMGKPPAPAPVAGAQAQ